MCGGESALSRKAKVGSLRWELKMLTKASVFSKDNTLATSLQIEKTRSEILSFELFDSE